MRGASLVAQLLGRFADLVPDAEIGTIWINGDPAGWVDAGEQIGATAVSLVVEDGRITRIFAVRNPGKLTRLREVVRLSRTA